MPRTTSEGRQNLWRQRLFRIFWTGETVSQLGSSVSTVLLPLTAVRTLHAGAFAVSLITAAAWLPWLVIGVPAGAVVDRLAPRRIMLVCDLAAMAAMLSVPIAAWLGVLSIGQVLVVALLVGVCAVLFRTSLRVYLPTFVGPADLAEANAKLGGAASAAQIAGPGAGGVVAQLAGPATGVLADAVSFVVSFACLTHMPEDRPNPDELPKRPTRVRADTAEGLRFLWHDPLLRSFVIFGAVANFGFTGFESVLVFFLVRGLHLSSAAVGISLALLGIGGVLGAVLARPLARRFGSGRVAVHGLVLGLPFALLIPLTQNGPGLLYLYAGDLVAATAVGAANVMISTFLQAYVPRRMLGRVSSATSTFANCAIPLGAASAGVLASSLGARSAILVLTACIAGSSLILALSPARKYRDLPPAMKSSGSQDPHPWPANVIDVAPPKKAPETAGGT